jgi:coenzyme F420-reducing hydrogenase gamma subunit
MAFDFKGIKRCGARCRTRGGAPCLGPAMKNGRCRMHGGVFSRLEKHGRQTLKAKLERKKERALLTELKQFNANLEELTNE